MKKKQNNIKEKYLEEEIKEIKKKKKEGKYLEKKLLMEVQGRQKRKQKRR